MPEPDPDWYPDPGKTPGVFRWWTGEEWTDLLASDPDAPPPDPELATRSVRPANGESSGHTLRTRFLVAAVLAAALTLLAVPGFRSVVASRPPEEQPSDLGTPKVVTPKITVDESREAVLRGRMTVVLPDPPFDDPLASTSGTELTSAAANAYARVHEPSKGAEQGWFGHVMFALLADQMVTPGDPEATARRVLEAVSHDLYLTTETQPGALEPVATDEPFVGFRSEIGYDVGGIPSTHDDLVMIFGDLDGEVGMWLELVPDDSPTAVVDAVQTARGTLAMN